MHKSEYTARAGLAPLGIATLWVLCSCGGATSPAPEPAGLRGKWHGVAAHVSSFLADEVELVVAPDEQGSYHGTAVVTPDDGSPSYKSDSTKFYTVTVVLLRGDSLSITLSDGYNAYNASRSPYSMVGTHSGDTITAMVGGNYVHAPIVLTRTR